MKKDLLKYFPIILLVFLMLLFGCTKHERLMTNLYSSEDSLSDYLSLANDFNLPRKSRQEYNEKAFSIIISQQNDSMNRINLFKIANRYYNMDNWKDFNNTVHLILKKSKTASDTSSILKAYIYLGDYYGAQGVSDTAFMYYSKAEKMYREQKDSYNLARTLLNKALLKYNESNLLGSEIEVFKALSNLKDNNAKDLFYESYNLLGLIYNEQGDYGKAIENQTLALASIDDKSIPMVFQSKATSLNNIGLVYQNQKNNIKAIPYFQEALKQKNLISDKPILYAMLLDNLAYSKFKINEFQGLPELFYQSLKLRDSLQLSAGIIVNKIHLAEYFAFKMDTTKAIKYSKEALHAARMSKNYRNILPTLKQLAIIEPKNAAVYTKEYIQINDSLQKAERKMLDKFTRIEYETEEIKSENTDLVQQNRNLVYIFSGLAMLGLFSFIIRTQKAKNRELLFKQQQQIANEEIYNLMISQQNTIEGIRIMEKK